MSAHSTPPRLMLKSTKDALLIIEAAERGLFHRLVRRLTEQERAESIYSGAVFVYDEFESNIKRFTDTLVWSPSRIIGNYLVYREMLKHEPRSTSRAGAALPPVPASARSLARRRPESAMGENERSRKRREQLYVGSLTNSDKFKPDGLVKRTFSLMIEGKHIHVIAYYTYEDAMNESFITPSEHPQFGELPISQDLLRDKSAYRVPPCIETLSNGQLVYAGEDSDKPGSPRSESTSLDTDHNSPIGTPPTGVTPDFSSLPSLPRVHLVPQEGSMYELPPLRPINPGSNWNDVVPSTFDGPAYSTHTRSNASPYSFNGNSTSTSSLAAISLPSLTPPPTRSAPRLRDARQMPYPVPRGGRPNAYNLNIARVHREPEHTPTDPAFEPDSAIDFSSGFGSTPPPYHEGSVSWAPSRFDNGGFGMRQQQRESEGATAPTPIRPRVYEVGPSGERVEYDVHIAAWGHTPLYSDGSGPNAHRNENRAEYEEMNPTDVGFT